LRTFASLLRLGADRFAYNFFAGLTGFSSATVSPDRDWRRIFFIVPFHWRWGPRKAAKIRKDSPRDLKKPLCEPLRVFAPWRGPLRL
jgi:hypothetical protein